MGDEAVGVRTGFREGWVGEVEREGGEEGVACGVECVFVGWGWVSQ